MIHWTQYPHSEGHYAQVGDMVLTAYQNGQWAVFKTPSEKQRQAFMDGKKVPKETSVAPRASADLWPNPCTNLEEAKQAAENAFNDMIING